jgi:hypothetical protein
LRRADNAKFIEHFRYVIVASQLLDEHIDQGALNPSLLLNPCLDGTTEHADAPRVSTSLYGAIVTAGAAFALVYLLHWSRSSRSGYMSWGRIVLAVAAFSAIAIFGYAYVRRQWLKFIRTNAINAASGLTTNWQAFELSSASALSFIQEVELVSKGYRLSTPLPPATRIEDPGPNRRCVRHRKILCRAYASIISACVEARSTLQRFIHEDDLEKYYEIYDINAQEAQEASLEILDEDPESLKSLRMLSYRAGLLRRTALCSLMALEADGGHPDVYRWRVATEVMENLTMTTTSSMETLRRMLNEVDALRIPTTPAAAKSHEPVREKMRSQVRKISALSSGIKGLQAKMQILREETNKSIEQSDDLTDLGPSMMSHYDAIGADLKDLIQAWEAGKAALQSNIIKHERRISRASSGGMRSPVTSLSGLTAVDEDNGSLSDALRILSGETTSGSKHSGRTSPTNTSPSEEETVFEAIAMPRQRQRSSTLSRTERILKMQEERDRQAALRARRDANTGMLRELESVIKLRPQRTSTGNVTLKGL